VRIDKIVVNGIKKATTIKQGNARARVQFQRVIEINSSYQIQKSLVSQFRLLVMVKNMPSNSG
jgi:hypothetical protein